MIFVISCYTFPFVFVLIANALDNMPGELEDASAILGGKAWTTARRVADVINAHLGHQAADAIDPSTVSLSFDAKTKDGVVDLLTDIEQLNVEPDEVARVVIDEANGIIVMGESVRISTVAVAQGNLTVSISESPEVSQPNPLSAGRTVVTPRSSVIAS